MALLKWRCAVIILGMYTFSDLTQFYHPSILTDRGMQGAQLSEMWEGPGRSW